MKVNSDLFLYLIFESVLHLDLKMIVVNETKLAVPGDERGPVHAVVLRHPQAVAPLDVETYLVLRRQLYFYKYFHYF